MYSPFAEKDLSEAGLNFIKCQEARQIVEEPQELIDQLPIRFFHGQSGARFAPTKLLLNNSEGMFIDDGHLSLTVDANEWTNLGSYQQNIYIDPKRLFKFSLNVIGKLMLKFVYELLFSQVQEMAILKINISP